MGSRRTKFSSAEAAKPHEGAALLALAGTRAWAVGGRGFRVPKRPSRMKALRCSPSPGRAHGRSAAEVFERPASQCASKPREGAALLVPPQRVHGRSADGVFERLAGQAHSSRAKGLRCSPRRSAHMGGRRLKFSSAQPAKRMKALRCSPSPGRAHGRSADGVFKRLARTRIQAARRRCAARPAGARTWAVGG